MALINRQAHRLVVEALGYSRVVFVQGARQVGKSTLAKWVVADSSAERFKAGVVLYTGRQTIPLGDRIWAVPISGLWA